MASIDQLDPYLTDHLAGSTAGFDLAQKLASETEGTPLGSFLAGLAAEIDADRKALEDLLGRLDIGRHPGKKAAGWMAEKVSRLRLNPVATGSDELTRLMEMETLSIGIVGKLCLWQTLGEVARNDPEPAFDAFDFDLLAKRAQDQFDLLGPHRRAAATRAFGGAEE